MRAVDEILDWSTTKLDAPGGVIRRAKYYLGHPGGPPYTRDVTDRGGEPTAKQQIEVLGLENSGEPWLDFAFEHY